MVELLPFVLGSGERRSNLVLAQEVLGGGAGDGAGLLEVVLLVGPKENLWGTLLPLERPRTPGCGALPGLAARGLLGLLPRSESPEELNDILCH